MNAQRVALVTGAAQGLGLAWVKKLVKEDYHVFLTARNLMQAEKAAIEGGFATNQVTSLRLDVSHENQMAAAADVIKGQFRKLDVLINNAGYMASAYADQASFASSNALDELSGEELLKSYRINTVGPVLMIKHFRELLRNGEGKVILNIGSQMGSTSFKNHEGHYGYCGSKQALTMLNKTAALELEEDGIASIVVHPGWVSTRMGGKRAPLQAVDAVKQMYDNVLLKAHYFPVGGFVNYEGETLPW